MPLDAPVIRTVLGTNAARRSLMLQGLAYHEIADASNTVRPDDHGGGGDRAVRAGGRYLWPFGGHRRGRPCRRAPRGMDRGSNCVGGAALFTDWRPLPVDRAKT